VSYRYPGTSQPVLQDVSLRIAPGEMVAIAGPSGCGKSTLVRLLLGFDTADEGMIAYGGQALDRLDLPRWHARVAAVLQGDRLGSASTLRSQVAGMAPCSMEALWQAARSAAIEADIHAMPMGMQTIVEGNLVSTGQEQRLLLARALVRRPEILLLDEATNAVPEAVQAQLLANLRALGITTILVTHRESAMALCDRVHVLEGGRVAWSGPPAQLSAQRRLLEVMRAESGESGAGADAVAAGASGSSEAPRALRNGLFRTEAVERYEQPIEVDVPGQIARWRPSWAWAGLAAVAVAAAMTFSRI